MISKTLATREQREALLALWKRSRFVPADMSYLEFRRRKVRRAFLYSPPDTLMISLGPIEVGIEPDGYTHS